MKIEHHITVSTIVSVILYMIYKSWGLSIASLLTGIFIDLDHIIDYLIAHGSRIHPREFLLYFYKEKHRKITLLFHAWEWLLCLSIMTVFTEFNPWISGACVGYGHHIIADYIYSKTSFRSYSFFWRWKNRFDSSIIFPRDRGYNPRV